MYLALEKRYNFTLDSMNVRAPAYEKFRQHFLTEAGNAVHNRCQGNNDADSKSLTLGFELQGVQIDTNGIDQQLDYCRGNDLELWHISLHQNTPQTQEI